MNQMNNMFNNKKQFQIAPGVHPGIKVSDLKPMQCVCGEKRFLPVSALHYASPLQATSGQPTIVQIQLGFTCISCGKINEYDAEVAGIKPPASSSENVNN